MEKNSNNLLSIPAPLSLKDKLLHQHESDIYRTLKNQFPKIDFCSNDYLGFSKIGKLSQKLKEYNILEDSEVGSTGSRLITGNSAFIEDAEQKVAQLHGAESGLIFNSGYDANLGLLSSAQIRGDLVLIDVL